MRSQRGQAAVELAALAPLLALAALAFAQLALAFRAELAGERAVARARAAAAVGDSAVAAARSGAPRGTRARLRGGAIELDLPSGLALPLRPLARVHVRAVLPDGPA
jgi:hypothetical protein